MVSEGDIKRGSFLGNEIYLLRNDSATTLHVKDNGLFHTPASLNGLNYKNEYVVGDTIPLSNQPFIFTEIDWNNSKLRLTPIHNPTQIEDYAQTSPITKSHDEYYNPFFLNDSTNFFTKESISFATPFMNATLAVGFFNLPIPSESILLKFSI